MHVYYELLVTSILILVLFPYSAKIRHSPTYFPQIKKVKVTGKNKKGKKLSKTLKCAVTVKTPKITAAPAQTVKVGATASVKPSVKPASAKLSYKSSDAAVAAVDANGVVTGVAAGKATVTVTAKVGTKTLTATTDVTVEANEVVLSDVKQTASNAFTATFSDDASKTVTKESFIVEKADKTFTLAVQSLVFAADGKSATITLTSNMDDGAKYNVTCQNVTKELVAAVGEVTKIEILTTKAQQGKKTAIEFKLWDAKGIDVTPAKNIDSTCQVNVTGSYSSAEKDTPSKANITMTTIGDKAEVEITYDSGAKGVEPLSQKGEIECVKAEAEKGNVAFKSTTNINAESQCAKFYKGETDKNVSVAEKGTADVYFCALNGTEAVDYDKYEVESSDENKFVVSAIKDTGKFLKITVTGNSVGTAAVNVTASKFGAATQYQIPVTVTKENVATSMTAEISRTTMSNSPDTDYAAAITVKFYDAEGKEVTSNVSHTTEITNAKNDDASGASDGVLLNGDTFKTGQSATAKTYRIAVKGQDSRSDKTFTKNLSVTVKKLPADAFVSGTGAKMTYQLEIDNKTLEEEAVNDVNKKHITTVKAYAECNGLFAGYVDASGNIADGNVFANAATTINSVGVAVRYGNEYYGDSAVTNGAISLVASENIHTSTSIKDNRTDSKVALSSSDRCVSYDVIGAKTTTVTATGDSVAAGYLVLKDGNKIDNTTFAKPGTWTVELVYTDHNSKEVIKSNTFTVKGLEFNPTVTAGDRKVDSLDLAGIKESLATNVDMNNDDGSNISIVGLIDNNNEFSTGAHTIATTGTDSNRAFIKYVVVKDNVDGGTDPIYYCVPLNATFTLK